MKLASSITFILLMALSQGTSPIKSQIKWVCDSHWKKKEKEDEREFDEKGNLIKWIQFTSEINLCASFKYEYEGKKILKEYRNNCQEDFGTTTLYKYGANDRLEEKQIFERGKLTDVSTFKFKLKTDKYPYQRIDYYNSKTEPSSINNLVYDTMGNLIEEEQTVSGSWFGTYTFKFNTKGQLIYETGSVDGGVGLVERYYIYENNVLAKDSVRIPGEPTEFHVYEITKW